MGTRGLSFRSHLEYAIQGQTIVILPHDARLAASVITNNSIKLSFAGFDNDCIINMSSPLMFSWNWTYFSCEGKVCK